MRIDRGPRSAWTALLAAALTGALAGAGAMFFLSGPLVRSALLSRPEIVAEAMQKLQDRELAHAVIANRAALETPYAGAWAGAKDGDVVLVEFFDYACPYCRRTNADIDRLLREDGRLKLVWRELPVLGPDSEAAAIASLGAARAGRYRAFHDALFAAGRPTPPALAAARKAAGLTGDPATGPASPPAMAEEISRNFQLARAVAATGTPTFIVGDRVLQGAVGYETLKAAIAEARAKG
jgi:protein-disulfide isomerase